MTTTPNRARGNYEMGDPLPSIFAPTDLHALEGRIDALLAKARAADAPVSFNIEGIEAGAYAPIKEYCRARNVQADMEWEQGRAPWVWVHADRGTNLDCDPATEALRKEAGQYRMLPPLGW